MSRSAGRVPVDIYALSSNDDDAESLNELVDLFFETQREVEEISYRYMRLFVRDQQTKLIQGFERLQQRAYAGAAPGKEALPLLAAKLISIPDLDRYAFRDQKAARQGLYAAGVPFAQVGDDFTTFHVRSAAVDIAATLWRLQFELTQGTYDGDDLAEVKTRLKTLADTEMSDADLVAREVLGDDAAFLTKLVESAATIGIDELRRFKRDNYHIAGATLIVAGHFDVASVTAEIQRLFGGLPSGSRASAPHDADTVSRAERRPSDLAMTDEDAPQLRVMFAYRLDPYTAQDAAALRVARTIIELRARLVRDRLGASYGVEVSLSLMGDDPMLVVSTRVSLSAAPKAVVELTRELDALRADSDIREDFVRARRRVLERLLITSADSESIADELELAVRFDLGWDYSNELLRSVAGVTHPQVRTALANALRPERATRLLVGPRQNIEATLEAVGASEVRWIE